MGKPSAVSLSLNRVALFRVLGCGRIRLEYGYVLKPRTVVSNIFKATLSRHKNTNFASLRPKMNNGERPMSYYHLMVKTVDGVLSSLL